VAASVTGLPLSSLSGWPSAPSLGCVVFRHFQRRHVLVGGEVLDHALARQKQREDQRQRQQNPGGGAEQVRPGIADAGRRMARKAANQGDDDDDAGGGGKEVLHRQAQHLAR
jgi:hypothetical protein